MWYDFTEGNEASEYEVGSYGGTCYGSVSDGVWIQFNNETGTSFGTNSTLDESIGPGGRYAGNVGLAADGKKYFGFVIANNSDELKFNSISFIFFGTGDVEIGSGKASEYFGITAGGAVATNDWTVTFNNNSGTTAADPATMTITSPPATNLGSLPIPPTKDGHLFKGWYLNAEGTGAEFTATTAVTASISVFAKWESVGAGNFVVTFRANEGVFAVEGGTTTTVTKVVEAPETDLSSVGLPDQPTRPNYVFAGWNTEADGTGTLFNADTEVENDIIVYAKWQPGYDLLNWTIAWLELGDGADPAIHFHAGDIANNTVNAQIQKMFVNTSKSLEGATYIFDSTADPAYVMEDDGGNLYWQGGIFDDLEGGPLKLRTTDASGYAYLGGFGTAAINEDAIYFGLIIKSNVSDVSGLADLRIQIGSTYNFFSNPGTWEFVEIEE